MDVADLFDRLCLRWAQEADVVMQQTGSVPPTLVLLPRDAAADEVAVRVDGLRGNLAERADAILAEIRPAAAPHDPAGLAFLAGMRVREHVDGVVVYVSLGAPSLRRLLAYAPVDEGDGVTRLTPTETTLTAADFAWLDGLLRVVP